MTDLRRILVQGPGAIGRLLAARLALCGADVSLVDYREDRAELIRHHGLELDENGRQRSVTVPVVLGAESAVRADLLIITVKAHDVAIAAAKGLRFLEPGGLVLVLSNGIGNLEALETLWPPGRCLAGTVSSGALALGDAGVRATGDGPLRIGTRQSDTPAARALAPAVTLFRRAGFDAERCDDLLAELWRKAAINCAVNPVAAILEIENGKLPESGALEVAVEAAREAEAIARHEGTAGFGGDWEGRLREICAATASNRCSMLVDLDRGRRTEIDALCGEVARRAAEAGIDVPVNVTLAALIRAMEGRGRQTGRPPESAQRGFLRDEPEGFMRFAENEIERHR